MQAIIAGTTGSGSIFESPWASFFINLFTFMLSGHVVGSWWYLFGLQASPCVGGALWAEHGVGSMNIEIGWERVEKEVFGEFFDGKHLDKECTAF
ncbi:hypothetical protein JHK87_055357 [Glycine soja]|nr:hypothetical protein JHK87_055357 [Glycine soja]